LSLSEKFHRTFSVQGEALTGGRAGRRRSPQPAGNASDAAVAGEEEAPQADDPDDLDRWEDEKTATAVAGD
jgi:hypothetical protein